ncbi:MAG TPA: S9 family peptidase [Gemmatimonadaceae bacterium]|nr:S9 family peptidase [Gemmatimonadaceae bacterium]
MPRRTTLLLAFLAGVPLASQAQTRRPLRPNDVYRIRDVRDPQRSPDGKWVSYTVSVADSGRDRNDSDVWMSSWDGTQHIRLTSTNESESGARWSPDGRYISFVSGRQGAEGGQIWLLDRMGGEAQKLTDFKGGVDEYAWSPDGKRIAVIVEDDPDTATAKTDSTKAKTAKPIVIDRYSFKRDIVGYLGGKRERIYLFDVATKKTELLSSGPAFDESDVVWSPDGRRVAFVSKRGDTDPDRDHNTDIWIADAKGGSAPRKVTTWPGEDGSPVWSPDSKSIAYLQGGEAKYYAYSMDRLAVVKVDGCPASGCVATVVTPRLDRAVDNPRWGKDGYIYFSVVDDRTQWVGRVRPDGGSVEKVSAGPRVVYALGQPGDDGALSALVSTDTTPAEVYAVEQGTLRRITHQNDPWLAELQLATVEDFESRSRDGTLVHGLLAKPIGYKGGRVPLLLRIHGGPNGQDDHAFFFERQLFAASGYAVLAVNYRGSAGRGEAYQTAIYGDWGNKEVVDLLGAVEAAVARGVADPNRLGIGGWSYGGILTDYTIATDTRFKGAISGAGSAMQIAMYGVDQYTVQYETELGAPWKNIQPWLKVSYPFLHADRIRTPTLFLVGEKDFNVPSVGSEQMYQALRSLGVPTQLVIYPGQHHGITVPSYKIDRLNRYLAWYDRWVKGSGSMAAAGATPTR